MRGRSILGYGAAVCASWTQIAGAVTLDTTDDTSILSAASTIAYGMMSWYTGNNTGDNPGNLPSPYYWWEAGAMFGTMVEYWYYTNDTTYNDVVLAALLSQVGTDNDFMPENQTKTEGNDDQGFWGMAAMSAAEMNFVNPPAEDPQWLELAQGVFEDFVGRWDNSTCAGGLRWQIFTFNAGYTYKNSIANGVFFNIASRIAHYTGDSYYYDWAEQVFDWLLEVGLISEGMAVYDGTSDVTNCTTIDEIRFSYNQGIFLFGAAMMYDYTLTQNTTSSTKWLDRTTALLNNTSVFFKDDVMYEAACEDVNTVGTCDTDQQSFKAYLSRWMAATGKLIPSLETTITPLLTASAVGAAAQCDGSTSKTLCGEHWTAGSVNDGSSGIGQMMSALSVIQSLLIDEAPVLVTNSTGGTSTGTTSTGKSSTTDSEATTPATTAGRAGAAIVTVIVLTGLIGGVTFMIMG